MYIVTIVFLFYFTEVERVLYAYFKNSLRSNQGGHEMKMIFFKDSYMHRQTT